jgi:hypothetical protein
MTITRENKITRGLTLMLISLESLSFKARSGQARRVNERRSEGGRMQGTTASSGEGKGLCSLTLANQKGSREIFCSILSKGGVLNRDKAPRQLGPARTFPRAGDNRCDIGRRTKLRSTFGEQVGIMRCSTLMTTRC